VDLLQHIEPVGVGQVQIEQDHVDVMFLQRLRRLPRVVGAQHAIRAQVLLDDTVERLLVVDHEHRRTRSLSLAFVFADFGHLALARLPHGNDHTINGVAVMRDSNALDVAKKC
jgi:hypothetical protein